MVDSGKWSNIKGRLVVRSRLKELVAIKERKLGTQIQQKDIAKSTGLTPNTVSRWMKPEPIGMIDNKVVERLCLYLDCELGDLIYLDVEEEQAS